MGVFGYVSNHLAKPPQAVHARRISKFVGALWDLNENTRLSWFTFFFSIKAPRTSLLLFCLKNKSLKNVFCLFYKSEIQANPSLSNQPGHSPPFPALCYAHSA